MDANYAKDFRESDNGKRWHAAVAESWFQEGLKVATATMTMPRAEDMAGAAANWHRMEGAIMFTRHLMNLTEMPKPRAIDSTANLKHNI